MKLWLSNASGLFRVTNEDGTRNVAKMAIFGVTGVACASFASYKLYKWLGKTNLPISAKVGDNDNAQRSSANAAPKSNGLTSQTNGESTATSDAASQAIKAKEQGNEFFKKKRYDQALSFYNQALELCPKEEVKLLAVLYQNRAAANDCKKNWKTVVADCTEAIRCDPNYQKAYMRRGKAHMEIRKYKEAKKDLAVGYYLQKPPSESVKQSLILAMDKDAEVAVVGYMKNRQPVLISAETVRSYLANFQFDPVTTCLAKFSAPVDGKRVPFQVACDHIELSQYNAVLPYLDEQMALGESNGYLKETLLLRATFRVLAGLPDEAESDIAKLMGIKDLPPRYMSTALLRKALLAISKMNTYNAFSNMTDAIACDPKNGDIYHHRGQINLLMGDITSCMDDTEKAISYNKTEVPALIFQKQMCELQMALHGKREEDLNNLMSELKTMREKYSTEPEVWGLYAQTFVSLGEFEKAQDIYDQAIACCPNCPTLYIQAAQLLTSLDKGLEKALAYLNKAKELDPYYENTYTHLGHVYLKLGKIDEGLESYQKLLAYTRSAPDVKNAMVMVSSVEAQLDMKKNFGLEVPNIFNN